MNLIDAQRYARELMTEHGLFEKGWRFEFDNARRRLGLCRYATKTISISRHMAAAATEDQVRQTMLHEIAHALVGGVRADGTRIGHGWEWKVKAREIGYEGARTSENPYQYRRPGQTRLPVAASVPVEVERISRMTVVPAARVRVGDRVQVLDPKYAGVYTAWKVGPSRVHIQFPGGRVLTVPHRLVRKVS